ncbi:MAG: pilus assembly protein TadE [Actinobacteria bacterium HGW-Actinobacteria-2]|nr:MAG: pilus assembly protein TadE [Actinobacteria bacterium HGW-Actinobacteria-2]
MSQRGTLTVEFALLVPAIALLFGLAIGGARVWMARSTVETIAGAAARAAVMERSPQSARSAAERLSAIQATTSGLRCASLRLRVDTAAFARPVGTPGSVTTAVVCEVSLGDVLVPGWPGTVSISASGSAPLDSYRGRK